ncbi:MULTISPECIES: NAD-dependent succinate-semialdehyde dehydrogenase [unclassified Beijerinckia]|uniref:NAD-dependent succinate-semialdehyde dehydrogenase n=1 Tax=unclassified Beijerinckia TaxID=2638183 RepID=UPI00089C680C|nr:MULTISPECIES: NAD-dependent succinate-semialdehyde dehydrogenase [unclassified Beijerinckia]MDH7797055.1 succinate-semialdehyde dehydrogenase/glutarate-semialdehyde dehydrogenase [Beijerinckia sp. GAS462]SEC70400.1 succinate-semialdehyde dehydrogenase / glutarate-semialdehyde dehydrogenase [Beijerinckia sp. 28-YEA-48]
MDSTYPRIGLYIDGQWIYDRHSCVEVVNPSNEAPLGTVPGATPEDLSNALSAAERGFRIWRDTPALQRSQIMLRASALVRERADAIARILTLEQGKPLTDARNEVARAAAFLEWDAAEAQRIYGSIVPAGPQIQQMIHRLPIGPVAAFTPWNVPIAAPSRKIGGAIAAGCSVIIKAAEETPGTACAFVQCFIDAGLPPGVLNLVFGNPVLISSTLIASSVIRMVTFTGSVSVGKHLIQLAAAAMKPVLMELGGHAPVLIGSDVDAAAIGRLAGNAKIRLGGQFCASPTRFIVHKDSYAAFVDAFVQVANEIRVGDGFEAGVQMGPLINNKRLMAIEELVQDAKASGARIAAGGRRIGDRGFFYAPTVLADVPVQAKAMFTEPFGPLALCVQVADLNEGIALANSLSVGLAGYAFTNSLEEAERLARELECGVLSINHFGSCGPDTPFGGIKESGIGREGGAQSLEPYTIMKTVLQRTARV